MSVLKYVEDERNSEFYPTPEHIVEKMLEGIDWNYVETVLEPSVGKGDILCGIEKAVKKADKRRMNVDCIEIDSNLRSIVKERFNEDSCSFDGGVHIVHDNFLTYKSYKEYDLIIMNPPFSDGAKHLLKALDMQKNGGSIVCLLNAETIKNPYTAERRCLVDLLKKYNADITYIKDGFKKSERQTNVETALIKINIPDHSDEESIFEKLAKAKFYKEPEPDEMTSLEVTDFVKAIVNRYQIEIESGIQLIQMYKNMLPYLRVSEDPNDNFNFDRLLICLTDEQHHTITINRYAKSVRLKYWKWLLTNNKIIGRLTSKLRQMYVEKVYSFSDYDFSEFNIYTLINEINAQIKSGVESEIEAMYDRLTEEHAYYPECAKNKHYYDGWKTNKAWKIDKKCILPCYGIFSGWNGSPRTYEAYKCLSDIEHVLNFFDGHSASFSMSLFTKKARCILYLPALNLLRGITSTLRKIGTGYHPLTARRNIPICRPRRSR